MLTPEKNMFIFFSMKCYNACPNEVIPESHTAYALHTILLVNKIE